VPIHKTAKNLGRCGVLRLQADAPVKNSRQGLGIRDWRQGGFVEFIEFIEFIEFVETGDSQRYGGNKSGLLSS